MSEAIIRSPRRSSSATRTHRRWCGPIHLHWRAMARRKGFDIRARVKDRYHVALECHVCGLQTVQRLHTLMTALPTCQHCMEAAWKISAIEAGVVFISRDPTRRHYARYRLSCGHETTRQIGFIGRVARGETCIRCKTCLTARRAATAQARHWDLLGPVPGRRPNYALYRHQCGHEQEIAIVNLATDRVGCGNCDSGWCAAPSTIYAIGITLPDGRRWIKVGYARKPTSRMLYQLRRDKTLHVEFARLVAVPSGHIAVSEEKPLHAELTRLFAWAVIPVEQLMPWLTVTSEVYAAELESVILSRLDALSARLAPD